VTVSAQICEQNDGNPQVNAMRSSRRAPAANPHLSAGSPRPTPPTRQTKQAELPHAAANISDAPSTRSAPVQVRGASRKRYACQSGAVEELSVRFRPYGAAHGGCDERDAERRKQRPPPGSGRPDLSRLAAERGAEDDAVRWLRRAAEEGDSAAMSQYELMLFEKRQRERAAARHAG
jgi:hypothetical protein